MVDRLLFRVFWWLVFLLLFCVYLVMLVVMIVGLYVCVIRLGVYWVCRLYLLLKVDIYSVELVEEYDECMLLVCIVFIVIMLNRLLCGLCLVGMQLVLWFLVLVVQMFWVWLIEVLLKLLLVDFMQMLLWLLCVFDSVCLYEWIVFLLYVNGRFGLFGLVFQLLLNICMLVDFVLFYQVYLMLFCWLFRVECEIGLKFFNVVVGVILCMFRLLVFIVFVMLLIMVLWLLIFGLDGVGLFELLVKFLLVIVVMLVVRFGCVICRLLLMMVMVMFWLWMLLWNRLLMFRLLLVIGSVLVGMVCLVLSRCYWIVVSGLVCWVWVVMVRLFSIRVVVRVRCVECGGVVCCVCCFIYEFFCCELVWQDGGVDLFYCNELNVI